jgi:hypothetical protein
MLAAAVAAPTIIIVVARAAGIPRMAGRAAVIVIIT